MASDEPLQPDHLTLHDAVKVGMALCFIGGIAQLIWGSLYYALLLYLVGVLGGPMVLMLKDEVRGEPNV